MPSQYVRVERKFTVKEMLGQEKTHTLANKRCNRYYFFPPQQSSVKLQDDPFKNIHAVNVLNFSSPLAKL
jgi:hypothetical protein